MNKAGFKGNKHALPQKICATCGKPMTWRKRWANNWEQVLHCSDRCRANARSSAADGRAQKSAP